MFNTLAKFSSVLQWRTCFMLLRDKLKVTILSELNSHSFFIFISFCPWLTFMFHLRPVILLLTYFVVLNRLRSPHYLWRWPFQWERAHFDPPFAAYCSTVWSIYFSVPRVFRFIPICSSTSACRRQAGDPGIRISSQLKARVIHETNSLRHLVVMAYTVVSLLALKPDCGQHEPCSCVWMYRNLQGAAHVHWSTHNAATQATFEPKHGVHRQCVHDFRQLGQPRQDVELLEWRRLHRRKHPAVAQTRTNHVS